MTENWDKNANSTIIWQTKSTQLFSAFLKNPEGLNLKGGRIYELLALQLLSEEYDVQFDEDVLRKRNESLLSYWLKVKKKSKKQGVFVIDPFLISMGKSNMGFKNIAIVHHINCNLKKTSIKNMIFLSLLEKNLKNLDRIVTVSQYWKKYLESIGCENVDIIYNSFDLQKYKKNSNDERKFRKKYNIPASKPVIYIGNSSRSKGVVETYEILKNFQNRYTLVMSGPIKCDVKLPVHHFDLTEKDFITLLNISDVVITMSKMLEGWNRTAHEAMLCKTPVIGSGSGGMKELLRNGGQFITQNYNDIPFLIEIILKNKKIYGEIGYQFAKRYNLSYFRNSWVNLIKSLHGQSIKKLCGNGK